MPLGKMVCYILVSTVKLPVGIRFAVVKISGIFLFIENFIILIQCYLYIILPCEQTLKSITIYYFELCFKFALKWIFIL